MARMFDTEFDYRDETYTATVVISGSDGDKIVQVKVPDELEQVVPEKKIILGHYNEDKERRVTAAADRTLVENILEAVKKHEEAEPPLGSLWG